jgi:protein-tyrosine kinase
LEIINRKTSNWLKKISLVTSINPNSKISEQYRIIRTNFLSSINLYKSKTILITSPNREDGKSTTAANFAISLAQQGKKVLLIDADLRNSTLHISFKADNNYGLSSVLKGRTIIEETIVKTEIRGLDFLPSGPVPFNPAELLGSQAMELLIRKVKTNYDFVLFDTPAVLEVADTKIIANQCDGLILVIRSGKTKSEEAIEAKKFLENPSVKLLGVILNSKA